MTCENCTRAAVEACHGFTAGCRACSARGVARGPNYFAARATGRQDWKYRAELELAGVTHDEVKAAAAVDFLRKVPQ